MKRIDLDGPDVDWDDQQALLYQGEPFTGEAVEYHPDGTLWTLRTFAGGFEEGPTRQWYRDGTQHRDGLLRGHQPDGEWREWRPDGTPRPLDVFDRGRRVSYRVWDQAGEVVEDVELPPPDGNDA